MEAPFVKSTYQLQQYKVAKQCSLGFMVGFIEFSCSIVI